MLRAVGAGLILCASLLARRTLLGDARAVQRTRRSLAAAFEAMEAEIRLLLTPLPTLLRQSRGGEADDFFAAVSRGLSQGEPLCEAWRRSSRALSLPEEDREVVARMGERLSGDEESVRAALAFAANRLRERGDAAERRRGQDERLTTALCVGVGLLLAIFLI